MGVLRIADDIELMENVEFSIRLCGNFCWWRTRILSAPASERPLSQYQTTATSHRRTCGCFVLTTAISTTAGSFVQTVWDLRHCCEFDWSADKELQPGTDEWVIAGSCFWCAWCGVQIQNTRTCQGVQRRHRKMRARHGCWHLVVCHQWR